MRTLFTLALCALVALAAGCTFTQGATGQEGVSNEKDNFYYGMQGVKSGKQEYRWENSKNGASVQWGVQGSGSVKVTLRDSEGKQVYQKTFSGSGQSGTSESSQAGKAGTWTVTLEFSDLAGQGGLRITAKSIGTGTGLLGTFPN